MRLTCPACGGIMSLDVALGNEGAREAIMLALQLPAPLGKILIQYVAMFRPATRQLSFDRVASLLGELQPMIEAAKIERHGRVWPAPYDYWKTALEDILSKRDKLQLPLKSHGYLLEIITGYANKAESKEESKREQERANPPAARRVEQRQPASRETIQSALKKAKEITQQKGGANAETA